MPFDNGLTAEQQADVDAKYEDLMEKLKTINLRLYKRLRANELIGSVRNVDTKINEDEQFEMEL